MGSLSLWHWALVVGVAALVLGGPRITRVMGEVGKGLHTMRRELLGPPEEKKDEPSKEA